MKITPHINGNFIQVFTFSFLPLCFAVTFLKIKSGLLLDDHPALQWYVPESKMRKTLKAKAKTLNIHTPFTLSIGTYRSEKQHRPRSDAV